MENDTIRSSGGNTLIDIWVKGKLRPICVTRAAIETFLGLDASREMSDEARCEFVRTHLPQVVAAAKDRLREGEPEADTVIIDAGLLGGEGERRIPDRRTGERRKVVKLPAEQLRHGERRRGERRASERRRTPTKSPPK